MKTTYVDVEPAVCKKCGVGQLHVELDGPTGYSLRCDSCDHSFPVMLGEKEA